MLLHHRTARLIAAGVLVLTAPALAACGQVAATDAVYTPAPGVNNRDARVDVLNALIVATEDGKGTFIATLSNNEVGTLEGGTVSDASDTLVSVTVDDREAKISEEVVVPTGGTAVLGTSTNGVTANFPGIEVSGDFDLGDFVDVVLTFENAGQVSLEIPVVANNDAFAGQDGEELTPTGEDAEHEGGDEHGDEATTEESSH